MYEMKILLFLTIVFFTELKGRYCYYCLDVAILESDREPENLAKSAYGAVVDIEFGSKSPPSCQNPSYVKCSDEKTCYSFQGEISGKCKFTKNTLYLLIQKLKY